MRVRVRKMFWNRHTTNTDETATTPGNYVDADSEWDVDERLLMTSILAAFQSTTTDLDAPIGTNGQRTQNRYLRQDLSNDL